MPVVFTKGDLFETPGLHAYAHGCNCAGAMGAGIALQFAKRWPRMVDEYRARCADSRFALGDVFVWQEGETTIYNLATQAHWKAKARIPALVKSLSTMVDMASRGGVERIGLPRIGAGLGGLDWVRVKRVLEEVGGPSSVTLMVFEQFVRAEPPG